MEHTPVCRNVAVSQRLSRAEIRMKFRGWQEMVQAADDGGLPRDTAASVALSSSERRRRAILEVGIEHDVVLLHLVCADIRSAAAAMNDGRWGLWSAPALSPLL